MDMRRSHRVALLVSALAGCVAPLPAQSPLFISVTDSATATPIIRSFVFIGPAGADITQGRWRYGNGDARGLIRIDSVPAGAYRLDVGCSAPAARAQAARVPIFDTTITDSARDTIALRLSAADCDQRHMHADTIVVRGWLESGFEHSRFVPCPAERRLLPAELRPPSFRHWIWAVMSDSVDWQSAPAHPRGQARPEDGRWAALVTGMLEGPHRYGHLGIADYRLTVLSVRDIVSRDDESCGASS
jgi:hypothetical protein